MVTPPTSGRSAKWLAAGLDGAHTADSGPHASWPLSGSSGTRLGYLRLASLDITSAIALAPSPLTSVGCCAYNAPNRLTTELSFCAAWSASCCTALGEICCACCAESGDPLLRACVADDPRKRPAVVAPTEATSVLRIPAFWSPVACVY